MTPLIAITALTIAKLLGAWFVVSCISGVLIGRWLHTSGQARVTIEDEGRGEWREAA